MAKVQGTASVDSLQRRKKSLQLNDEIPKETQHIHKILRQPQQHQTAVQNNTKSHGT